MHGVLFPFQSQLNIRKGLKVQHVTSIQWLADVTGADVEGLSVGSKTLTFVPKKGPTQLTGRSFEIKAETDAASALLILQAIFPFVLFASNEKGEPLSITIHGGTNVQWSLSYEYFDQVLMPALEERFAIRIERKLNERSWNTGRASPGSITLTIYPVPKGGKLHYCPLKRCVYPASYDIKTVNISMIVPSHSHEQLQNQLFRNLGELYPDAGLQLKLVEDSGSDSKWNLLLVAESHGGIRWATDVLRGMPKKMKLPDTFVKQVASSVCRHLDEEISLGGTWMSICKISWWLSRCFATAIHLFLEVIILGIQNRKPDCRAPWTTSRCLGTAYERTRRMTRSVMVRCIHRRHAGWPASYCQQPSFITREILSRESDSHCRRDEWK